MCRTLCELHETEFCKTCKGRQEEVYTMDQWAIDGSFNAEPMQEVAEEVYYEFLNSLPPLPIPRELGMCGFMNSEPYIHNIDSKGRYTAFYAAFGKSGDKYYYLGLVNKYGEKTNK